MDFHVFPRFVGRMFAVAGSLPCSPSSFTALNGCRSNHSFTRAQQSCRPRGCRLEARNEPHLDIHHHLLDGRKRSCRLDGNDIEVAWDEMYGWCPKGCHVEPNANDAREGGWIPCQTTGTVRGPHPERPPKHMILDFCIFTFGPVQVHAVVLYFYALSCLEYGRRQWRKRTRSTSGLTCGSLI